MKVDFDSLRGHLANATNNLIDQFNEQQNEEIDKRALHSKLERLRESVGTILALYSDGGDTFSDLDIELEELDELE